MSTTVERCPAVRFARHTHFGTRVIYLRTYSFTAKAEATLQRAAKKELEKAQQHGDTVVTPPLAAP